MTKRDIFTFYFKWQFTILGMTAFVVVLVILLVYLFPPSYRGESSVLVQQNRSPTLRSVFAPGLNTAEVLNTEVQLVMSRTVMAAVVDKLEPHNKPPRQTDGSSFTDYMTGFLKAVTRSMNNLGLTTPFEPRERWIRRLRKNVVAKPIINSDVIEITYQDQDPEWAARITNAITKAYIQHHLDVYSEKGGSVRFQQQLDEARSEIARRSKELSDFKQRASAPAIDDSQRAALKELSGLREQLAAYGTQLTEALTRFEPDHSEVVLLRAQIDHLNGLVVDVENRLLSLEMKGAEIDKIKLELNSEEEHYRNLKTQYEMVRLNARSGADQVNVSVIDYSPVPETPVYSRLFFILVSFPAAFMLAMTIAVIREYFDRRVTDPETAEAFLGVPELGSIERFGVFK